MLRIPSKPQREVQGARPTLAADSRIGPGDGEAESEGFSLCPGKADSQSLPQY